MILGVRAHESNPWLVPRLRFIVSYYSPLPKVLVSDFGSQGAFREQIARCCAECGYELVHVEDDGLFSLSSARNIGFEHCDTDYCLFSDVDYVYRRDIFQKLAEFINEADIDHNNDIALCLPMYHLTEMATSTFLRNKDSAFLLRLSLRADFGQRGKGMEFVAPYSNAFLFHRRLFNLVGGYDVSFRGHGSEDFELMVRMAHVLGHPIPYHVKMDCHRPCGKDFFAQLGFRGFRRIGEYLSFVAETNGFKAYHLWHERLHDDWSKNRDVKRNRFNAAIDKYSQKVTVPIIHDFINRNKKILCLATKRSHYGLFLPLRALDYSLNVIDANSSGAIVRIEKSLSDPTVDSMCVVASYDDVTLTPLLRRAKMQDLRLVVIEDILPGMVHYGTESLCDCQALKDWHDKGDTDMPSEEETREILTSCRSHLMKPKDNRMEHQLKTVASFARNFSHVVLVSLHKQGRTIWDTWNACEEMSLDDEFISVAADNVHCLFLVSLDSGKKALSQAPNIALFQDIPVGALHGLADCVVSFDARDALAALLLDKPFVTIGGLRMPFGQHAMSLAEAVRLVTSGLLKRVSAMETKKFLAWLIWRKLSHFMENRPKGSFMGGDKAAETFVTRFVFNDELLFAGSGQRFLPQSYCDARLGLGLTPLDGLRGHLHRLATLFR